MTRKRIAIVLPDLRPGGVEGIRLKLAHWFLGQGYQVDLVLRRAEGVLLSQVPPEARIIGLQAARVRRSLLPLHQYLRAERPAAVLAALWPLTAVTLLSAIFVRPRPRVVVSEHSTLSHATTAKTPLARLALKTSLHALYPRAAGIVAVSSGVADDMARIGRLPRQIITVIHNPSFRGRLPSQIEGAAAGWAREHGSKIVAVGTLKAAKDYPTLIRAFRTLCFDRLAKLLILGGGHLMDELKATTKSLGVVEQVVFLGHVEDPYPFYVSSDLFVLSSRYEGFPNVMVEAMECGLPVVSTDCPSGPAEILDGGRYGRLVPVGDAEALARAMISALSEPADPARQQARAAEFGIERAGRAYLQLLDPEHSYVTNANAR